MPVNFSLLFVCLIVLPINCIIKINDLSDNGSIEQGAGSDITLHCSSEEYTVKWILPNNKQYKDWSNPINDGRGSILAYTNGETILIIKSLQYTDTGSYKCAPENDSITDSPVSLYLFVKDMSDMHTFLHWSVSTPKSIISDTDSYIPCLVTDQTVTVRLFIKRQYIPYYAYDPRKGFFVPANSLKPHNFQASCKAYESETSADDDFKDALSLVLIVLDKAPINVELDASGAEHAYASSCMTIVCSLNDIEQTFLAFCSWTIPDNISESRVKKSPRILGRTYETTIEVCDLKTTDSGVYTCSCTYSGAGAQKSTTVTVSETEGQVRIVDIDPPKSPLMHNSGDTVTLTVKYESWPDDLRECNITRIAKWHHIYVSPLEGFVDELIDETQDRNIVNCGVMESESDSMIRQKTETLKIKKLRVEDSGNYSLVIHVKDLIRSVDFELVVKGDVPQLSSFVSSTSHLANQLDPRFIQLGSPFQYICLASLVNLESDAVNVYWCPYARQSNCLEQSLGTVTKKGTYQIAKIAHIEDPSNLLVGYGMFSCRANDYGQENQLTIYVTDVPNSQENRGFSIISEHLPAVLDRFSNTLYEGDGYYLSCDYQKYLYTSVEWQRKDNYNDTVTINSILYTGKFSDSRKLSFEDMKPMQSGQYICSGRSNQDGETTVRYEELTVKPIQSPTFSNLTFQQRVYEANYTQPFSLFCSAEGAPEPSVRWFKDGQDLHARSGLVISNNNQQVTLLTVVKEDAGIYTCFASNRAGQFSRNMTLSVIGLDEGGGMSGVSKAIVSVVGAVFTLILLALFIALILIYRRERMKDAQLLSLYNSLRVSKRYPKSNYRKRRKDTCGNVPLPIKLDPKRPLNNQVDILGYDRQYEVEKSCLKLEHIIGEGQFGKVHRGYLTLPDPNVPTWKKRISASGMQPPKAVAIKVPKDGRNAEHQKALLDELKIMVHLGIHPNVLGLVAAVTKLITKGELYVVVELCQNGSLLEYIRAHRTTFVSEIVGTEPVVPMTNDGYLAPNNMLTTTPTYKTVYQGEIEEDWESQLFSTRLTRSFVATCDLLSWAYQISNGMRFLASNYLIHRDLAARNCLLTDDLVVKIADFGLARQNEQYHIDGSRHVPLPIKWMALESIVDYDYTVKSDVWSFGVLIWELFTLGEVPYPTQPLDQTFIDYLKQGHRLEQPDNAPDEIYKIMRQCWLEKVEDRPTFNQLMNMLDIELNRVSQSMRDWTLGECRTMRKHSYINIIENNMNEVNEDNSSAFEMDTVPRNNAHGAIDNDLYITRRSSSSHTPNCQFV